MNSEEIRKFQSINAKLTELYELKNKNNDTKNEEDVEMLEEKNEYLGKYVLIQIHLFELFPREDSRCLINQPTSPHEMLLGVLKGVHKYKEYYRFNKEMFNGIGNYVTPNLNKRVWFWEKDLVEKSLLTVYARMNTTDMTKMLSRCPIPGVKFSRPNWRVNTPQDFEKTVNSLDSEKMKSLDFIPYLRDQSKRQIYSFCVYRLAGKIKLCEKKETPVVNRVSLSSSSSFQPIYDSLDSTDIESIDGMISNVILDITIRQTILYGKKQNDIQSLPATPSTNIEGLINHYFSNTVHFPESLIVPVNVENNHWFLVVFEFEPKLLHVLDSLPRTGTALPSQFVAKMEKDGWTINTHARDLARQGSGTFDCGVFVILYAESFILKGNFVIDDQAVAETRRALKQKFEQQITRHL